LKSDQIGMAKAMAACVTCRPRLASPGSWPGAGKGVFAIGLQFSGRDHAASLPWLGFSSLTRSSTCFPSTT
jgi:hypothetical protein